MKSYGSRIADEPSGSSMIMTNCEIALQKPLAMKTRTLRDYEQKLSRARAYIVQHLDDGLDTRRLAVEASMSLFHFHRVYLGFFGERPAETIRRLRLDRASMHLRDTKMSLREIGRLAGYTSTPAFTRAFKRYSGLSPGAFRKRPSTAAAGCRDSISKFTALHVALLCAWLCSRDKPHFESATLTVIICMKNSLLKYFGFVSPKALLSSRFH